MRVYLEPISFLFLFSNTDAGGIIREIFRKAEEGKIEELEIAQKLLEDQIKKEPESDRFTRWALEEEKISCPEQVAVIGYDGLERGKYVRPPLTSIRQPLEMMGREMVKILIRFIEGEEKKIVHKEFQPDLIIRRSVG